MYAYVQPIHFAVHFVKQLHSKTTETQIWLLLSVLSFQVVVFPTCKKSLLNWHSLLGKCAVRLRSRNGDFATPWIVALCPWGFSRQEYWSGLPCPPPGDLHNPGKPFKMFVPSLMENLCFWFCVRELKSISSFASFEQGPNGPPSIEFYSTVNVYKYILVYLLRMYMFLNV